MKSRISKVDLKSLSTGHFFDKASMRFFNSKLETDGVLIDNKAYFITSERYDKSYPKKFTIRELDINTGKIEGSSSFQEFESLKSAEKALMDI